LVVVNSAIVLHAPLSGNNVSIVRERHSVLIITPSYR
jgi:hypothetical protein